MRDYLTADNLLQGAGLSALVTLLAIGRLQQSDMPLLTGVVMLFVSMTLVCATVTAWGRQAGMAGVWTSGRTLRRGLLAALALGLALWPVFLLWLDPRIRAVLASAQDGDLLRLAFPPTTGTRLALILWALGFQTLFLLAAPMSVAARLTDNGYAALGLCALFRIYVAHRQVVENGLTGHMTLLTAPPVVIGLIGCLLFSRFGLAPAMFFAAVLDLRLLPL